MKNRRESARRSFRSRVAVPGRQSRMQGRWRPALHLPLVFLALLLAAFAIAESMGWRFLAAPVERLLSQHMEREVRFGAAEDPGRFRLQLIGGIRLDLQRLYIGPPAGWTEVLADGEDVRASVRYRDLLGLRRGEALPVHELSARRLDIDLARQADGRANWTFGAPADPDATPWISGVRFGDLRVADGKLRYADAPQQIALEGGFRYQDSSSGEEPPASASAPGAGGPAAGLIAQAQGTYRGQPLVLRMQTGRLLELLESEEARHRQALELRATGTLGHARLAMQGKLFDIFSRPGIDAAFSLSGPSLAAAGEPLGVTLPQTPPFSMRGRLAFDGKVWNADIRDAQIGRSQLSGVFAFTPTTPGGARARLEGNLNGKALWLQDLGPSIGTAPPAASSSAPVAAQATKKKVARAADARVLPDRSFDLPSLKVMDADVQIALDRLELGTELLQDIRPLRAHLLLRDGVLALENLDARMAGGQVAGRIALDGRASPAQWDTRLTLAGVALERWLELEREKSATPYVAGRVGGLVELKGKGNSTAQILASSEGLMRLMMVQGSVSHLGMEIAGLDVAQALGVLVSGDKPLPVSCGVAALSVSEGMVRPELFVLDTPDSVVSVSGGLSLATERLDLTARVSPKDLTPVALRTPVRVRGTFAHPSVSVEPLPVASRVGAAAALALINPFAALIPLVDTGDERAREDAAVCAEIQASQRTSGKLVGHDLHEDGNKSYVSAPHTAG